jgi:DNA-binding NarL/FixJ family response regulator
MKIRIDSPTSVLFVDDQPGRVAYLRYKGVLKTENVERVVNAYDAIELVKSKSYDVVFLDHDLETYEQGSHKEITGQDVAKALVGSSVGRPACVVIHSMNPIGAEAIERIFNEAGILAYRAPILELESC